MLVTQRTHGVLEHWSRFARTVAVLLATLSVVAATFFMAPPAHAATVIIDGIEYETDDSTDTAIATSFDRSSTVVVIPATIPEGGRSYTVTTIGTRAFVGVGLTSLTIPDSVTTIGDDAFATNSLTSLAIPNSVTTISTNAFASNMLLTGVTLGNSVTTIGAGAFAQNPLLTSVAIPDSVTTIGNGAFISSGLTSVTFGNSVTTIGEAAFYFNSLTAVTIPNSVTAIGVEAFAGNNLATVTIGGSVTTIGNGAFMSNKLTSVAIPNSVTAIGEGAFADNALTSITLGSSVATIGEGAFAHNVLAAVTFPSSVATIGGSAFVGNAGLVSAVFEGAPPTMTARGPNGSLGYGSGLFVYYPSQFNGVYDPGNTFLWQGYAAAPNVTLGFDLGGHGAPISSVTVPAGSTLPSGMVPADPAESGYTFTGWFTTATGNTAFDFTAPLASDATAFAQWTAVVVPSVSTPAASMPTTGAELGPMATAGAGLLLIGTLALAWACRRRHLATTE